MRGKRFLEQYARVHVEVDISSEYRYRNPILDESCLVIPVSQSGETADTLAALRFCREAEISGNLHHPNIITVYDFGQEGSVAYLVQESVGRTLYPPYTILYSAAASAVLWRSLCTALRWTQHRFLVR